MNIRLLIISVILISIFPCTSLSVVKGSNTAVSVESAANFLAADLDNTMLGFGWFKNGFTLEDATTTCTFDSVYPISGTIDLKGGSLYLSQDLLFKNITTVQGWGSVFGNSYLLDFCSSITWLPSDADVFDNVSLFFNKDFTITNTVTFKGNCLMCGNGNALILGSNAALAVDQNATLQLRDMAIMGAQNSNIYCIDDTGKIILDTVAWVHCKHK